MGRSKLLLIVMIILAAAVAGAGCVPQDPPDPCEFTGNSDWVVYRVPEESSDVFGTPSSN